MKPRIYILTIFLWTAFSCGDNFSRTNKISEIVPTETLNEDDYKIINATFPHLVVIFSSDIKREFGYNNFNYENKDIPEKYFRSVFFTSALVPLNDTTVFYPLFNDDLIIEDTTIQNLFNRLFTDKQTELFIDVDSISNTGLWKLKPVNKWQKVAMEIGERRITYSKIQYNKDKTKAIFYFQNDCSGLCGFGMFVVVEKINGIWSITKEYYDWVS